jgi:tetratricopeptide (TPR) repeat protein
VAALVVRAGEVLRVPAVVYGFAAIVLPVFALLTWRQAGTFTDEETLWRDTLARNPDCSMAHNDLGSLLRNQGRMAEAMEHHRKAIQSDPNNCEALNNLGVTLAAEGRFDEAIENFRQAIQLKPDFSEALDNLGTTLAAEGWFDEAIENYYKAIQIHPNFPEALNSLGIALAVSRGRLDEAVKCFRQAIQIKPNYCDALNNLAWILASNPDDTLRNGAEAIRLAERACELTHYGNPLFIRTLAAAYAEAGRFPEAVATAEKAEQLATAAGSKKLAEKNRLLLEIIRSGKPYHEPAPAGH